MTRDWREGQAKLADLRFTVVDTCGVEPQAPAHTIQVTPPLSIHHPSARVARASLTP